MFNEARANRWLVEGIICTLWWECSALLSRNVLTLWKLRYTWHSCVLCHLTIVLSALFTWEGEKVHDKRRKGEYACYARWSDDTSVPLSVCTQVLAWMAGSAESWLQWGCICLGVLAHFSDYWCTVGSFTAVVYFTSCGCIPVVVVSGTGCLFSVVRAYGILSLWDGQWFTASMCVPAIKSLTRSKDE